jgi:hypothetical protein
MDLLVVGNMIQDCLKLRSDPLVDGIAHLGAVESGHCHSPIDRQLYSTGVF